MNNTVMILSNNIDLRVFFILLIIRLISSYLTLTTIVFVLTVEVESQGLQ